jgi:hypothetical protein
MRGLDPRVSGHDDSWLEISDRELVRMIEQQEGKENPYRGGAEETQGMRRSYCFLSVLVSGLLYWL